jgi:RNA polymerase sigma-70 factor (ECF subfamily)
VERQLVERAQRGDPEAFDRLTELMMDRLYSVAFRILRQTESAEDVTQQALVSMWRQLPRLRDPERFEAWCYRLLVNASYAEHRRRTRVMGDGELDKVAADDPYLSVDHRDQLERGFRRLSAEQRAVLVLQHYLNLSHAQMADVLGVPVGTVRSRLHGARMAMRAALEADARPGPATGWLA